MQSLGDLYSEAIERKYDFPRGWKANWPPGFDYKLGQVGTIDDEGRFSYDGKLSNYQINAREVSDPDRADGPWQYQSNEQINIEVGTDASLPAWKWLGNAKAGLKVGFAKSGGLVLAVGSSHVRRLADLDRLRKDFLEAAQAGRLHVGQAVIVEMQVADCGLVIASMDGSGELTAKTNFDVTPSGGPALVSFAADFRLQQASSAVSSQSFPDGFPIAFRVLQLGKRGWFWWRRLVVLGLAPAAAPGSSADVTDAEESLDEEDYWAPYVDD